MMFSTEASLDLPRDAAPGRTTDSPVDPPVDPSARAQALARSLEGPRARSVERLERFVAAARDLANEQGSAAFTVAQVSRHAGLSLKSFYRCFAGKDDLLVALLEEDSRLGAAILGDTVDAQREPVARVRAYVLGIFELVTHPGAPGYARVLVSEHQRLAEERPETLRTALAPMVDVLTREIERATEAGLAVSRDARRDAETIFVLLLEGIHAVTLGRADAREQSRYLWGFCAGALRIHTEPDDMGVDAP
jgi:AcrR family transcriptional regulator